MGGSSKWSQSGVACRVLELRREDFERLVGRMDEAGAQAEDAAQKVEQMRVSLLLAQVPSFPYTREYKANIAREYPPSLVIVPLVLLILQGNALSSS